MIIGRYAMIATTDNKHTVARATHANAHRGRAPEKQTRRRVTISTAAAAITCATVAEPERRRVPELWSHCCPSIVRRALY